jgi:hypothetical protein
LRRRLGRGANLFLACSGAASRWLPSKAHEFQQQQLKETFKLKTWFDYVSYSFLIFKFPHGARKGGPAPEGREVEEEDSVELLLPLASLE